MSQPLARDTPPHHVDLDGVLRIGGIRVTLNTVVAAFGGSFTLEEIARQDPSLTPTLVYTAITYFLPYFRAVEALAARRKQPANISLPSCTPLRNL
jgi:uncharacterized protein (DUF433 family)